MSVTLTAEQLQQIISQAVAAAAAGGGAAAPQSVIPLETDLTRLMNNILKMRAFKESGSKHVMIWNLVNERFREDPSAFELRGGIHTDADGGRTYITVKYRAPEAYNRFLIHIYGSLRGAKFMAKSADVFYWGDEEYRDAWVFAEKGKPVPGWGGDGASTGSE